MRILTQPGTEGLHCADQDQVGTSYYYVAKSPQTALLEGYVHLS